MKSLKAPIGIPHHKKNLTRISYTILVLLLVIATTAIVFVIQTKEVAFEYTTPPETLDVFPIGVHPAEKRIVENPAVDTYFGTHISTNIDTEQQSNWLAHVTSKLALHDWYQNLASPISRILVILSGERWEQVAKNFSDILRWTEEEKIIFTALVAGSTPELADGKFYPGNYVVQKDASPEEVAQMVIDRFDSEVRSRYTNDIAAIVPMEDALVIASLLEREAYDFTDMREISGVIWNRLFIDMNLQLDATLQYAKGSRDYEPTWWPRVRPADKYIDSDFNTYQNGGLPPLPIANPSAAAILAALNPSETECLFYFHDDNSQFHCSPTYEGHVSLLKEHYGRGR